MNLAKTHNFPDDATGDALRRIVAAGDDLTKARDIDYSVTFPSLDNAFAFCAHDEISQRLASFNVEDKDGIADVTITIHMIPGYDAITGIENLIEEIAGPLGGTNDGWGCFSTKE